MSAIPHYLFRSCRNKDCAKGCVLYIPVSNPDFIPSFNISTADQPTWIAVPCKGCSCLGSQHLHSVEFPDRPSSCGEANYTHATPEPSMPSASQDGFASTYTAPYPAADPEAFPSTAHGPPSGVRRSGPRFGFASRVMQSASFKAQAQKREEREAAASGSGASTSNAFDPTAKAYTTGSQLHSKPEPRKRKRASSPSVSGSAPAHKQTKKEVRVSMETYTVVLVPDTVDAHYGLCKQPSLYALQRLDKEGRVKSVSLPKDKVSNKDIVTAVCNTFKADPRFAVIDSGWHLLRVLSQGTGRSATMELMEGGSMNDITFEVWKKGVNPSIRNAGPGYRHPVFIVLAMPNSPNEVHDSPSHDEPTPSSVHDKTGANTMSTPSEPTHNDYPDWQEMPVPQAHQDLVRHLHYMHPPPVDSEDVDVSWWPESLTLQSPFNTFFSQKKLIEFALRRMEPGTPTYSGVDDEDLVTKWIPEVVFDPLAFIVRLATELKVLEEPKTLLSRTLEKRFVKDFALGPFGLHGVIPILDQLYGFVIYYVPLPAHHRSTAYDHLELISQCALALVKHFKYVKPRWQYDPPGPFRDLSKVYDECEEFLKDATHADWNSTPMKTFAGGSGLQYVTPQELVEILTQSFGHASDASAMNEYSLKAGEFGVGGVFSDLVEPLLDWLPLTHPGYKQYYQTLEVFCSALASRLRTHLQHVQPEPDAVPEPALEEPESSDFHKKMEAASALNKATWRSMVRALVTTLSHPSRPLPEDWPPMGLDRTAQFKILIKLYHSDHNQTESVEWQKITHAITQAIIAKHKST
ncbi:hypothetical protein DICSQDRAFT_171680 [Dichomitus squalens LYAD-421 SS1]|uniref:Uncharacterized protein n=1 Tax=Dichomitus squalens (strain LYAD-421) TaxID=732165 RepID=R7SUQ7_DICSQ|nr:uncharacterized protein DICSQDRAFT_171680 [Dichomitus squalens LYAD-421 SS1]EJF59959.1 hypothetical protein DICSQDRAFT_171680 [Dichomitus squalens LYAD-421 SS1]